MKNGERVLSSETPFSSSHLQAEIQQGEEASLVPHSRASDDQEKSGTKRLTSCFLGKY